MIHDLSKEVKGKEEEVQVIMCRAHVFALYSSFKIPFLQIHE